MKKYVFAILVLTLISFSLISCQHEHTYNDWQEVKSSTCTEKGEKTGVCSCGDQSTIFIPSLDHTLDANNVCSSCGQKVFNLSAQEKINCSKVFMYSNAKANYVADIAPEKERIDFAFSLNEESEAFLDSPAFVDIKIYNFDKTIILYENTFTVDSEDYSSHFFENNTLKKLMATVSIPKQEIKDSAYSRGYLAYRIYNSDYFDFDQTDPQDGEFIEIKEGLPECEHTYNELTGICSKCNRNCDHVFDFATDRCKICNAFDPDRIVIEIKNSGGDTVAPTKEDPLVLEYTDGEESGYLIIEEFNVAKSSKTAFSIYVKAKITGDELDREKNYCASLGYKLYYHDQEEGYDLILQSAVIKNEISSVDEYFIIRGSLTSLTPGLTYTLCILQ